MSELNETTLRAALQEGLHFHITPSMRFISISLQDGLLRLLAYLDQPPEDESDMLEDALNEAGGHLGLSLEKEVVCMVDRRPFHQLNHLDFLVFARHEADLFEGMA